MFLSVIIPLYNKENSIVKTVISVLNQTFVNLELIVVDDGSSDSSLKALQVVTDDRLRIITKSNGGVSSARNKGIKEATSEYIAFIDGDDIWSANHLQTLCDAITDVDNRDIGGYATNFYKSGNILFDEKRFIKTQPILVEDYFDFVSKPVTKFNSSTILIKKSKVLETGLYDEEISYGEDVEFWMRLFDQYKLVFIESITAIYHVEAENRSAYKVIPLEKRFHKFNYKGASESKRRYLDKLVAILIIDYGIKRSVGNIFRIVKQYPYRLIGVCFYFLKKLTKR